MLIGFQIPAHTMLGPRSFRYGLQRAAHATNRSRFQAVRQAHTAFNGSSRSRGGRFAAGIVTLAASAYVYDRIISQPIVPNIHAEEPAPIPTVELEFEKPRKQAYSEEDNREIVSSQHVQVKRSWENPGVYAWGANSGKVAAPDSDEKYIKLPRRIPFFDGLLLRDIQLDRNFGAAIDEKGDLLQWGIGYSNGTTTPTYTLKGKDLKQLVFSKDRILGLGRDGAVYSIPVSKKEQEAGPKLSESSWMAFTSYPSPISYRKIEPKNLGIAEKVVSIAGGLEHVLLLTNKGRLYSAASGSEDFPQRGQLGIPGLTWTSRPEGPYYQPHEITALNGFNIKKIAAGAYHSLALDKEGRLFVFGDNSLGQLGHDYSPEVPNFAAPTMLSVQNLYAGTSQLAQVKDIAAGGNNTYFTVDAKKVASPMGVDDPRERTTLGRITADTWACGQGLWGNLANSRWTHSQGRPVMIPSLSGKFEYDETKKSVIPIRLSYITVGATHCAAVMDNITSTAALARKATKFDTNWGSDPVFWGNNEFYQLGTGKRNNANEPVYIQPLDRMAEKEFRLGEEHRFQISPKHKVKVNGRWVDLEQRLVCGRGVTAVYSTA